jgi:hypothetical protein
MSFVWIIRQWNSLDSFWEHVRENKDFDVAYKSPDLVLNEIKRIVEKEEIEWKSICSTSETVKESDRDYSSDVPSLEQVVNRPFIKFLTISSTDKTSEYWQSWYVERITIV